MSALVRGRVKWFDGEKGFGFIVPDNAPPGASDARKDVFVHVNSLVNMGKLAEGQPVTFEIEEGKKGLRAVNVCEVK